MVKNDSSNDYNEPLEYQLKSKRVCKETIQILYYQVVQQLLYVEALQDEGKTNAVSTVPQLAGKGILNCCE